MLHWNNCDDLKERVNEIEKKSGLQIYKRLESIMLITSMSHLVYSQVSHATTLSVMWARLLSCDSNTGGHEDAPPSPLPTSLVFDIVKIPHQKLRVVDS